MSYMEVATGRKVPLWLWWVAAIVFIAGAAVAAILLIKGGRPVLPSGLAERRAEVARILEEAARTEDVDIRPLVTLEAEKKFEGAMALMDQALVVNDRYAVLNASLFRTSDELTRLALGVRPDEIGAKAVEAFGFLAQLAQAEKKFYESRRQVYEMTRNYYADLAAKRQPAIPENLASLVEAVNADLARAKDLQSRFSAAIRAFDEAASRR